MEKVGKDAVMQVDRDRRAGRGGSGEMGGKEMETEDEGRRGGEVKGNSGVKKGNR